MKKITLIFLAQMMSVPAFSHGLGGFKNCSPMSHDPKCWEQPSRPQIKPVCTDLTYCTRIQRIIGIQNGNYICEGSGQFFCTEIVKKYGIKSIGIPVLVNFQRIDACHVLGGCGGNACQQVSFYGSSNLSSSCR